jgi:thioredoxin 1
VAKCNVDDAEEIAMQYRIMSIPTLLFFKNGEVVDKRVGVVSKDEIVSIINSIA